jgi:hypothetical protein
MENFTKLCLLKLMWFLYMFFSKHDQLSTKIELDLKSLVLFDIIGIRNFLLSEEILSKSSSLSWTIWSNNSVTKVVLACMCPFLLDGPEFVTSQNQSWPFSHNYSIKILRDSIPDLALHKRWAVRQQVLVVSID